MPFQDYRKSGGPTGLYYIFGTDLKHTTFVNYGDAIRMLDNYQNLQAFCRQYADFLCTSFDIEMATFEKKVMLLLLKYETGRGIWLHVDNVARTDGVPVCTINIGPPDVNVDFIPVTLPTREKKPIRINLNEGDMLVMQGESRYEWAHGIPNGLDKEKYTVMFKFEKISDKVKVVGHSTLLDTDMYVIPSIKTGAMPAHAPFEINYKRQPIHQSNEVSMPSNHDIHTPRPLHCGTNYTDQRHNLSRVGEGGWECGVEVLPRPVQQDLRPDPARRSEVQECWEKEKGAERWDDGY
jgi:hypothetical protein